MFINKEYFINILRYNVYLLVTVVKKSLHFTFYIPTHILIFI